MKEFEYLASGHFSNSQFRSQAEKNVQPLAKIWLKNGIRPDLLEVIADRLGYFASHLEPIEISKHNLQAILTDLPLPEPIQDFLQVAVSTPMPAEGVAGLAVHLLDIAEAMALRLFVPEIPALCAKSDRTGYAARNVGVARHLKG